MLLLGYQYERWNIKDFIIKFIIYNSTIMPKVNKARPTVIPDSDSDQSSAPIVETKKSKKQQVESKKVAKKVQAPESDSEDEVPVVHKKANKQIKTENGAVKKVAVTSKKAPKPSSSQQESSEEEKPKKVVKAKSPMMKAKSPVQKAVVAKKKVQQESDSEEESSQEVKPKKFGKVKSPVQQPLVKKGKGKVVQSSSEESEESEKPTPKVVAKGKSPLQKAIQKVKSPLQKAQVPKKKQQPVEESSDEESSEPVVVKAKKSPKVAVKAKPKKVVESSSEEEEAPVKQVAKKQAQKVEMVEEDEEGEFQICIKGLSFNAYEDDVRGLFETCGEIISCKLLMRPDGKPKGLAFVKFSKKSAFNKALELNETQQFGRNINVEQSMGKKDAGFQRGNDKGGFKGGNKFEQQGPVDIKTATLFIGGLSYNSTVESLTEYFSGAGEVIRARIVTDRESGKPRGFGYVEFPDVGTAKKAYEALNGGYLDGRSIRLDSAAEREPRPQGGGYGGGQGGYGGGQGGFQQRGAPRNAGNSTVDLSQDDKFAKKGAMGTFTGKKMAL